MPDNEVRWLLLDEQSSIDPVPVAFCADIDGLFVDRPAPPRERFTLLGCAPVGRLRAAVDAVGTDAAWLGNVLLRAARDQSYDSYRRLLDVTVVSAQPSAAGPAVVDIELDGLIQAGALATVIDVRPGVRPQNWTDITLTDNESVNLGRCREVDGVYHDRPQPPSPPATLIGCRPEPPLQRAIAALPGGTPERRRVSASLFAVDAGGTSVRTFTRGLSASVVSARPSQLGGGLLDVAFDGGIAYPMPPGAREIWDLWYAGRPTEPNLWAGYDRPHRQQWCGAALAHIRDTPDRPDDYEYHLDGRYVTDIEGFFCAVGEAINGPGGYFGGNLNAFNDCLSGGFGAPSPFRLVWHDSAVARQHLVPNDDRRLWHAATTLDYLLEMFAEHGVEVTLD